MLYVNFRAKVLVCNILPRAQSYFDDQRLEESVLNDVNTEALAVNFTICLISDIVPRLDYVEFPSFLQNHVIRRHTISRDGLHLSFRATQSVAEMITSCVPKYLNAHRERQSIEPIFHTHVSEKEEICT